MFRTNDYISSVIRPDDFQSSNHKDKSSKKKKLLRRRRPQKEVFFRTQPS